MDKFSLMVPNFLPSEEYFHSKKNHTCIGCGVSLAARHVGKAVETLLDKAVSRRSAGGSFFGGTTEAAMLTIKNGKNEIIICLDDEPENRLDGAVKKALPALAVAEGFKYVATASPSYPFDLYDKMKKALETEGKSYVHILCPCPLAWEYATEDTVKVGFWAVESQAFPLYEVGSGHYSLSVKTLKPRSLGEYIEAQGRFGDVTEKQLKAASATVQKEYKKLLEKIQPE